MFLNCLGFFHSKHTADRVSSQKQQYLTVIEELCHRFSLPDIKKSTNNFDESRVIGRGLFSQVYKGCLQHNGASDDTVAIKRYTKANEGWKAFKNEVELLCQLRHPNIISLVGFCNHEKEKIVAYKYMSNGSLDGHLQGGDTEALSWKKRLKICIGVARGLHYLHAGAKRTIIHCILCPSTILLDDNMEPKLTGFGVCVHGPRFNSKPKPIQIDFITGTHGYMAMEYAIHGIVTDKCDVFSFGMILLDLVCGDEYLAMPKEFLERPVEMNIDLNINGNIAPECWQVFMDITQRCVKHEADERPTMGEVEVELEHALSLQEQADVTNTSLIGTHGYMAMEYAIHGIVTDKCDVFSFGMILLDLVCGDEYLAMPKEFLERPVEMNIDLNINGNIAPECWQVFMDITQRCVKHEADERPTMGEVEVELEHALSLQEQADVTNTNGEYTLLSKTIINLELEREYF